MGASPTRRPLQPEATEAVMEVTKQGDYEHDKMAEIEAKVLAGEIPPDVAGCHLVQAVAGLDARRKNMETTLT